MRQITLFKGTLLGSTSLVQRCFLLLVPVEPACQSPQEATISLVEQRPALGMSSPLTAPVLSCLGVMRRRFRETTLASMRQAPLASQVASAYSFQEARQRLVEPRRELAT